MRVHNIRQQNKDTIEDSWKNISMSKGKDEIDLGGGQFVWYIDIDTTMKHKFMTKMHI